MSFTSGISIRFPKFFNASFISVCTFFSDSIYTFMWLFFHYFIQLFLCVFMDLLISLLRSLNILIAWILKSFSYSAFLRTYCNMVTWFWWRHIVLSVDICIFMLESKTLIWYLGHFFMLISVFAFVGWVFFSLGCPSCTLGKCGGCIDPFRMYFCK